MRIVTASADRSICTQYVLITLAIANRTRRIKFVITDNFERDAIVLGKKWLLATNPLINWKAATLTWWDLVPGQSMGGEQKPSFDTRTIDWTLPEWQARASSEEKDTNQQRNKDWKDSVPAYLWKYEACFTPDDPDTLPPHRQGYDFEMPFLPGAKIPPPARLRPQSKEERDVIDKEVKKLLERGWIVPQQSRTAATANAVPKTCPGCGVIRCVCPTPDPANKRHRIVYDYRPVNAITVPELYRTPCLRQILTELPGHPLYFSIDVDAAFHRLRVKPEDEWKTAFVTHSGTYVWKVMPFGVLAGPTFWQKYIDSLLSDLLGRTCHAYADDIAGWAANDPQLEERVEQIVQRLHANQIKIGWKKCEWRVKKLHYLGYVVTENGIETDPRKLQAIHDWKVPQNKKDVQSLLGFANFYREFIPRYSEITVPLSDISRPTAEWVWTRQHTEAFEELRARFEDPQVLAPHDPTRPVEIETDASERAFAGIIMQEGAEGLRPVAYFSRKFTDTQRAWPTTHRELYAIVYALTTYDYMMRVGPIKCWTDHQALRQFRSSMKLNARLQRWSELLSGFDIEIQYRRGKDMQADFLTRRSQDGAPGGALREGTLLGPRFWTNEAWSSDGNDTADARRQWKLAQPHKSLTRTLRAFHVARSANEGPTRLKGADKRIIAETGLWLNPEWEWGWLRSDTPNQLRRSGARAFIGLVHDWLVDGCPPRGANGEWLTTPATSRHDLEAVTLQRPLGRNSVMEPAGCRKRRICATSGCRNPVSPRA